MSDTKQVTSRLMSALERIERGVEKDGTASKGVADNMAATLSELSAIKSKHSDAEARIAKLTAELKQKSEQQDELERKLKSTRVKSWNFRKSVEKRHETQKEAMQDLDDRLQALAGVNRALRRNNRLLREANAEGLPNSELINTSLQAELEALRATRDVEIAEITTARETLKTLLDSLENDAELVAELGPEMSESDLASEESDDHHQKQQENA